MLEELQQKFLPEALTSNLMAAGLFLLVYDLLKREIIDKVKDFYMIGFDESGLTIDPKYETEVKQLDKHLLTASCKWLVKRSALTEEQVADINSIREHRNDIAHKQPELFFGKNTYFVDIDLLKKAKGIIGSLGRFWGEIEVSINPDFDDKIVDAEKIKSGISILTDHIVDVVIEVLNIVKEQLKREHV